MKTAMTNRVDFLTRRDAATAGLEDILGQLDVKKVEAKLADAKASESPANAIQRGEARVAELTKLKNEALQALDEAIAATDQVAIRAASVNAKKYFVDGSHEKRAEARVAALQGRAEKRTRLEKAVEGFDSPKIERALQLAQEAQVDAAVIRKAEKRLLELEGMRTQARKRLLKATKGRDSDGIKAAIKDAERLKA